jgi:tripartite-type tricarboxylate transporter receptor subunit TctC
MKRAHIGIAAVALASFSSTAYGQIGNYPNRPIRIIVGYSAGGSTDLPARYIAEKLSAMLGQRVLVENRPGASGMIGAKAALAAPRDGYTLFACGYLDAVNSVISRSAEFKVDDIAGVTLIARYDYVVAASADSDLKSWESLVTRAKGKPDSVSYGHLGPASSQFFMAKQIEKIANVTLTGVPYKASNDAMVDVIGRRIDIFAGPPIVVGPLLQSNQAVALAVTGNERLATLPNVPTLKEKGTSVVATAWLGLCGGAGVPKPIIEFLSTKIRSIIDSEEYRVLLQKFGSVAVSATPAEVDRINKETAADAAVVAKENNITVE